MMKREWIKKLLAVALSLTVAVTFVPLLGDMAFAEEDDVNSQDPQVDVVEGDESFDDGDALDTTDDSNVNEEDALVDEVEEIPGNDDLINADAEAAEAVDICHEEMMSALSADDAEFQAKAGTSLTSFSVWMKNPNKVMHIYAQFTGKIKWADFYLDTDASNNFLISYVNGTYIDGDVDMSKASSLSTHKIIMKYNLDGTVYKAERNITVSMYDKPSLPGTVYAYHNYIDYSAPWDTRLANYGLKLQYSADGVNWTTLSNTMSYWSSLSIGGLQPDTYYHLRSFYTYRSYSGNDTGNYLYLGAFKTGKPTVPKIKSIKVKAYKVKKKKAWYYGAYTGLPLFKYKYYSYKIKITVKLKKKPGTAGICINGKYFKGNKKKYTVKLGPYTNLKKPRGKKMTVYLFTLDDWNYGSYSPWYSKTKKIK